MQDGMDGMGTHPSECAEMSENRA